MRLRLPALRATTAHLCSAYPFLAEASTGSAGAYLGVNLLSGGGGFAFDPFEAYGSGLVTNPNMLVAGEPGSGKSTLIKAMVNRGVGVFGRWVALVDPKGEYGPLADHLDLSVIRLRPGGTERLNPLEPGPDAGRDPDELARRQGAMAAALVARVLERRLSPVEDAALSWAVSALASRRRRGTPPTLVDLTRLLGSPTAEMAERAGMEAAQLARAVDAVRYALGKLLDRSLRGMFDGTSTTRVDWDGPGVVLDLSALHHDTEALGVVMVAATAWLQSVLAQPGRQRFQVLDEAWALLASEHTARYLQACWKLCRAWGVANVAVVHRLSDLRSQADDGTATAKVAAGLLADTQTRVLFRQSPDQARDAAELLGLTATESNLLTRLPRGRALWKLAGRSAVVDHAISPAEVGLCDTDAAMRPNPGDAGNGETVRRSA